MGIGGVLSAGAVSFGSLPVGTQADLAASATALVSQVEILDEYVDGGDASDFTLVTPLSTPVDGDGGADGGVSALPVTVQESETIAGQIAFRPGDAGPRSSALVLVYDPTDQGGPSHGGMTAKVSLSLSGTGIPTSQIQLQVYPLIIDFGQVELGQLRQASLKLTNLNLFSTLPTLGAFDGGQFAVSVPEGFASKQTEVLEVAFAALTIGPAAATLLVQPCPSCVANAIAVQLKAEVVDARFTYSPEALDFGFVLDGTTVTKTVTVTASGNVPVTLGAPTFRLANGRSSVFSIGKQSIPPGTSLDLQDGGPNTLTVDISYTPSNLPGGDFDTLDLSYSIGGVAQSPVPLVLFGNRLAGGCQLVLGPVGGIDFGEVLPGAQATRSLSVTNQGGAACQLSGLTLDGGGGNFRLGATADGGGSDGGTGPAVTSYSLAPHAELLGGGVALTFQAPPASPFLNWRSTLSFSSSDPLHANVSVPLTAQVASPYAASSPWPRWGHDNANTGQSEVDTSASDGGLLWAFRLGAVSSGPMLFHNAVYATGANDTLYGLDEQLGGTSLVLPLPSPAQGFAATPSVGTDGVFILSSSELYQLDPLSKVIDSAYVSGGGFSIPVLTLSQALIVGVGSSLDFFPPKAAVGSVAPLSAPWIGSTIAPAVSEVGGQLISYWCSAGSCQALSGSGLALWQTQLAGPLAKQNTGAPVLGNGLLYALAASTTPTDGGDWDAGSDGGYDGGLDDAGNEIVIPPMVFGETVVALDPATGKPSWSTELPSLTGGPRVAWGGTTTPALAFSDNLLIAAGADGVYALQAAGPTAGSIAWKLPVDGGVVGTPAIGVDGTIYLGTNTAGLLAINPTTHLPRWSFVPRGDDGRPVAIEGQPAIGPYGIYFIADNGVLYGVH